MKPAVFFVLLIATSIAPAAYAQETADEVKSRELFTQAAKTYDEGSKNESLRLYRESYALVPRAKTLLNIGVVLSEIGEGPEAANTLTQYLEDPDADRERLAQVRDLIAEQDKKSLRLRLSLKGQGGISVNQEAFAGTQVERVHRVWPGKHIVTVGTTRENIKGKAGEIVSVNIDNIDNIDVPSAAMPGPTQSNTMVGGSSESDRSIVSHPALWTGVVALAAAGVGTGFALSFRSTQDELDEVNANSGDHPFTKAIELRDKAKSRALAVNIAFGVAGAAAVATVVLYLAVDRDGEPGDESIAVAPTLGLDYLGVGVTARF